LKERKMSVIIDIIIVEMRQMSWVMNPMYFIEFEDITGLTARP